MDRILRGDVVWANLDPVRGHEQAGLRPMLIVSNDAFNERSGTIVAIPLTSREPRARYPLSMEILSAALPKRSWAKIGRIRVLASERVGQTLGRASDAEVERVMRGVNMISR